MGFTPLLTAVHPSLAIGRATAGHCLLTLSPTHHHPPPPEPRPHHHYLVLLSGSVGAPSPLGFLITTIGDSAAAVVVPFPPATHHHRHQKHPTPTPAEPLFSLSLLANPNIALSRAVLCHHHRQEQHPSRDVE